MLGSSVTYIKRESAASSGIILEVSLNANKRVQSDSGVGYCMEYHGRRALLTRYDVSATGETEF
jgi:hypothetical protein